MKRTCTHIIALLLFIAPALTGKAITVTYTINSNTNASALAPSVSNCGSNTCIFNIKPGVTLTLDGAGQCKACTFNYGTVIANSASFFFYSPASTFYHDTVIYNNVGSTQGGLYYNDSVAINIATTLGSGTVTIDSTRMSINSAVTCQSCAFDQSDIHVNAAMTVQTALTSDTTTFTFTSTSLTSSSPITMVGGGMVFNNTSWAESNNLSLTNAYIDLYGTSSFAGSGAVTVSNNSGIVIGDGSSGSTAYFKDNGTSLVIDNTSTIGIANYKNYFFSGGGKNYTYKNAAGTTSTVTTVANNANCGTAGKNACNDNYVYGCATLNSIIHACVTLAIANISLTAVGNDPGRVTLSWSDNESTPAEQYTIQRSTGDNVWSAIATVTANAFTAGDYHYTDNDAPAGAVFYRIQRTDATGSQQYSPESAVDVAAVAGARPAVGIYPNPASGGRFYITTAGTDQLLVNIYTGTGQLLLHAVLQGQTQYPVQLPSQPLSLSAIVVQIIYENNTRSFTILVR